MSVVNTSSQCPRACCANLRALSSVAGFRLYCVRPSDLQLLRGDRKVFEVLPGGVASSGASSLLRTANAFRVLASRSARAPNSARDSIPVGNITPFARSALPRTSAKAASSIISPNPVTPGTRTRSTRDRGTPTRTRPRVDKRNLRRDVVIAQPGQRSRTDEGGESGAEGCGDPLGRGARLRRGLIPMLLERRHGAAAVGCFVLRSVRYVDR